MSIVVYYEIYYSDIATHVQNFGMLRLFGLLAGINGRYFTDMLAKY